MNAKRVAAALAFLQMAVLATTASATGVLGTPAEGGTVSGIGVVSGYHCTSNNIEVRIDGASLGYAGAGTTLLGTQGVCGRTDTGYSLLYNFNNLQPGQHVVEAYADGVLFGSNTFTSVQSGGVPWLSGASKSVAIPDFPQPGKKTQLEWVQSSQNFLVTGIDPMSISDLSGMNGTYLQPVNITQSGSNCYYYGLLLGPQNFYVTVGATVPAHGAFVYALNDDDVCFFGLEPTSWSSASGHNMSGNGVCASDMYSLFQVTATGLKKHASGTKLQGTVKLILPGCTETITMQ